MPRGASIDVELTDFLHANGLLVDGASFVARPFKKLETHSDAPHLFLAGKDKEAMRKRIFSRDKETCRKCGKRAPRDGAEGYRGEWHHVNSGIVGRCDCLANGEVRCGRYVGNCHTGEHPQVKWTRNQQAEKEFERIHEEGTKP